MDGNWSNLCLAGNYAGNGSILGQEYLEPVRKFKFSITEDRKFGVSAGCKKPMDDYGIQSSFWRQCKQSGKGLT